jgi:predicted transcriptional regulator
MRGDPLYAAHATEDEMTAKRTMTLNLTDAEMRALDDLSLRKDLTKTAVLRQALRLYQTIEARLERGDKLLFENDATKEKAELMLV